MATHNIPRHLAALSTIILCLLTMTAAAQAVVTTEGEPPDTPTPDLRPLSVTMHILVEEYDGVRVVKSRQFVYELFFRDDGTPATKKTIDSAFTLRHTYIRHFDRVVTADPRADLVRLLDGDEPGLVLIRCRAVLDPRTGLPDNKIGSATLLDKNGRAVWVLLTIKYRDWKRRQATVTVIEEGEP